MNDGMLGDEARLRRESLRRMTATCTFTVSIGAAGTMLVSMVAPAPADPIIYFTPAHLKKQGTNQTPIAGSGQVVVKVLVNTDGTFKVQNIIRSTNHGDDAAALEIAKSSTYAPATRGPVKVLSFYDFTLKFAGKTASNSTSGDASVSGELATDEADLHSGKYQAAQTSLQTYVAAHPADTRGQLDLAVADTYLNDYKGGADAFDKAGTVPPAYKAVAIKAYDENAIALLAAKDLTNGLPAAKHAVDFAPGFVAEDTLGVAQLESNDAPSAIATLEKAHALGASDSTISAASRTANDVHLVQAYLANGDLTNAQKYGDEAKGLDAKAGPNVAAAMANYYAAKAQDAAKAGKFADAGGLFVQAADADPSQAVVLYDAASFQYLKATPDALNDKAKDAAGKALAINPSDASANYATGIALANEGKKSDAQTALNKAETFAKAAGNTTLVTDIDRALKQLSGGPAS